MQSGVYRLQLLAVNPCNGLHRLRTSHDFPGQPPLLSLALPNEYPKISVPRHHLNTHPAKELLRPGYIPRSYNQNTFGRLQVVSPWRAPCLKVPKMRCMCLNFPPALTSSAYHICVTRGWDPQIPLMRGSTPMA